ncbi:MAG: N-acetylneuraminate synthase family protein [Candidatus Obscuribacterales bacterium]
MQRSIPDNLFVLELANNHMGDIKHGLRIIAELAVVCKKFPYKFAIKLQYRHLDTFIHPDYAGRDDIKYVKRFSETRLTQAERQQLIGAIAEHGFLSMCTPFDEASVDDIERDNFDIVKVGSCSFTDWPLLERIGQMKEPKPVILSTGGATRDDIDNVYGYFDNRKREFAFMHCIAEYPTRPESMQLNQIDWLRQRYPEIRVGYSTHETPGQVLPIAMAVAKGCTIFEKHVGVASGQYALNDYSSDPAQVEEWISTAHSALSMCGAPVTARYEASQKENSTLLSLRRGVFVNRDIAAGAVIKAEDVFMAIPTVEGQITANDWSKYMRYVATEAISAKSAVLSASVRKESMRDQVLEIVARVQELLRQGNIVIPRGTKLEISHHYGMDKFYDYGAALITVINRDYCKKLIAVLPGQKHPTHAHKKKDETLHVLHGKLRVTLDGETRDYTAGEMIVVEPLMNHSFESDDGCVFEEISSTHYKDDSVYTDESINQNAERKTLITYWNDFTPFDIERLRKKNSTEEKSGAVTI